MTEEAILQLGAPALLLYFAIKEFFSFMRNRNEEKSDHGPMIVAELKRLNDNHLHTLQESNERLIDTVHQGQTKMIEILGEIKGSLNSR